MNKRIHSVLLAEDDEDDVAAVAAAVEDGPVKVDLVVARDGIEAIRLLKERANELELAILDLNMPKATGFDVLAEIRRHDRLALMPVVIFTTSQSQADALQAYRSGGNCFITKPFELDAFAAAVHSIESFWLSLVTPAPPQ